MRKQLEILVGDCLAVLPTLPADTYQTCVTSPPYLGLRDYGVDGQIGQEGTVEGYVSTMVEVFREVRRTLRDDGTLWLNLGDSYSTPGGYAGDHHPSNANSKSRNHPGQRDAGRKAATPGFASKNLLGIPWRVAFALQANGWILRSAIVWNKPSCMPEAVRDRPTSSYEMVFLFAKQARYFYDADAIAEPAKAQVPHDRKASGAYSEGTGARNDAGNHRSGGFPTGATRNARNVWTLPYTPFKGSHFATMPQGLAEKCILAGSRPGDRVLDPFGGAGTTALVAQQLGRAATIIELNPGYAELARQRLGIGEAEAA